MSNKNALGLFILILIVGGIITFNNFKNATSSNVNKSTKIISSSSPSPTFPQGTILIKGFNTGFTPKEITVKQGDTVKIRLVSDDSPHTFTIDELGVDQQFNWGKDVDVSFIASKKGTFQFYCRVPGHKEAGMVGTLTVI